MSDEDWSDDEVQGEGPRETISSRLPSLPAAPAKTFLPPVLAAPLLIQPTIVQQAPTAVQTVLSLAVQLFPVLNNPAVNFVAGFSLFYDPTQRTWTFLAYDQAKRSVMLEELRGPALTQTSFGKHGWMTAPPLELQLEDGAFATLTDHLARKWRVQFRSREDAHRLLAGLTALTVLGQPSSAPSCRVAVAELEKGSGHSLSSKYFARLSVRAQLLHHGWSAPEAPALCVPPELEHWDPLGGGFPEDAAQEPLTVEDLKGAEDAQSQPQEGPRSLGEALHRMKEGAIRLLVLPAHSGAARELLSCPGATEHVRLVPAAAADPSRLQELCSPARRSVLVLLVRLDTLSKKRTAEKKDKKKKDKDKSKGKPLQLPAPDSAPSTGQVQAREHKEHKEHAPSALGAQASSSSASSAPAVAVSPSLPAAPVVAPAPAAVAPAVPVPWPGSLVRAVESHAQSLRSQLEALRQCTAVVPATQRRILKALMSEMYEGLLDDLQLRASLGEAEHGAQQGAVACLQQRLRAVVEGYVQRNQAPATEIPVPVPVPVPGTLSHLEASLSGMLSAAQPLGLLPDTGDGHSHRFAETETAVLGPGVLQQVLSRVSQQAAVPREPQDRELRDLRAQLARQGEDLLRMGEALLAAEEAAHKAAEHSKKLQQENQTLQATAATVPVFEQGLGEMRKLYESELAERQKLEGELRDLSRFTAKMKLAWVPDKAQSHCLLCASKFALFGSRSKHHCRYCGRLFCKQCCTSMEIPEFGYQGKVTVCGRCFEFRQKVKAELGADDADEHDAKTARTHEAGHRDDDD